MSDKKKQPVITNPMDMDPIEFHILLQTPPAEEKEVEEAPSLLQQDPFKTNIVQGWLAGQIFPILLLLMLASPITAQQPITIWCGVEHYQVLPETANRFNLKHSDILTPEKFEEVMKADIATIEREFVESRKPVLNERYNEFYRTHTTINRNGFEMEWQYTDLPSPVDSTHGHYPPVQLNEIIIQLADAMKDIDPLVAIMLRIVAGTMTDPDPLAREKLSTLMVNFAKGQIDDAVGTKRGN